MSSSVGDGSLANKMMQQKNKLPNVKEKKADLSIHFFFFYLCVHRPTNYVSNDDLPLPSGVTDDTLVGRELETKGSPRRLVTAASS